MSTSQTKIEASGSGPESDAVPSIDSAHEGALTEESSSCEELIREKASIKSPEQYADLVRTTVEILKITVNVAPQKATSFAKLAVDLMFTDNARVYSDLHRIFGSSVREFVTADPEQIRASLTEAKSSLKRKRVKQLVAIAEEFNKELEERLEAFNKFDTINIIEETTKREIEKQCFTECAKSLKEAEALLNQFYEQILKLANKEKTIGTFLLMQDAFTFDVTCSLLIKEIEFAKGLNLIASIYGNLSLDFLSTVKKEIERRREQFEKYQNKLLDPKYQLAQHREYFKRSIPLLEKALTGYLSSAGIFHVETMSILAVNILLSKTKEEAEVRFDQMKFFVGKHCRNNELDAFKKYFLNEPSILRVNPIVRKYDIQLYCLKKLECKATNDVKDEFSNPLSLVDKAKSTRLMTEFNYGCEVKNPFKKWPKPEKSQFVGLFLLRTIVAKTGSLTSFESQAIEAMKKGVQTVISKVGKSLHQKYADSCQSSESEVDEQNLVEETEAGNAEQLENLKEESETVRSDI